MRWDVVLERSYPHPPERVWWALTDREALTGWLMPNDFLPHVGHTFSFRIPPRPGFDGLVTCRVVEVEAPHTLAYTWQGSAMGRATLVRFTLRPERGGTRLRLEHSGFEGLRDVAVGLLLGRGWGRLLRRRLAAFLRGGGVA